MVQQNHCIWNAGRVWRRKKTVTALNKKENKYKEQYYCEQLRTTHTHTHIPICRLGVWGYVYTHPNIFTFIKTVFHTKQKMFYLPICEWGWGCKYSPHTQCTPTPSTHILYWNVLTFPICRLGLGGYKYSTGTATCTHKHTYQHTHTHTCWTRVRVISIPSQHITFKTVSIKQNDFLLLQTRVKVINTLHWVCTLHISIWTRVRVINTPSQMGYLKHTLYTHIVHTHCTHTPIHTHTHTHPILQTRVSGL
jgi:hypothetical protein